MIRTIALVLLAAVLTAGATGCKKKKTAAELQEEKVNAFRARQKNEAIKAYTALVTKYPDSEYAPKAKERLNVLGPLPAATPAAAKH